MGCASSVAISKTPSETPHGNTQQPEDNIFGPHQKKLVIRTWKILSSDLTGRGSKVFLKIFEIDPAIKNLFPCRDLKGDDLLKDINFKGHASRFMQAVGAVVENINNYREVLAPLLKDLGRQHVFYKGFRPDYFNVFQQGMLIVWKEDLGDKFTESTRRAWEEVFGFIMEQLKTGFEEARKDVGTESDQQGGAGNNE